MEILNVGLGEMIVIFIIAMLVFGPERLPEIARRGASILRDLQEMSGEVNQIIQQSINEVDEPFRETRDTLRQTQKAITDEVDRAIEPVSATRASTDRDTAPTTDDGNDDTSTSPAAETSPASDGADEEPIRETTDDETPEPAPVTEHDDDERHDAG